MSAPAIPQSTNSPAFTIRSIQMRGHSGRWGFVHLIYKDGRQIATAGTLRAATTLVRQLEAAVR